MIIKQKGCGEDMARILIAGECEDEKIFSEAIAKYGRRDVYWAIDPTVANRFKAEALGIDSRLNLVGSDVDPAGYEVLGSKVKSTPAPKPKSKKSKKTPKALDKEVEAVVDESEKVL